MNILEIRGGACQYSTPVLNKKKENLLNSSLDLIVFKVFSFFDSSSFKASSCVCKYWKQLATELSITTTLKDQPELRDLKPHCFTLSIATTANAGEIAEVVVTAFSKGDIFRKVGQRRTSTKEVIGDMQTPNNRWYMITVEKRIVAAMLYISDSVKDASVHMLSSHPDYWGQKLGTLLIRKAGIVAKQQGKINLNLSAAHTNVRLIKYYETLGFKKVDGCKEEEYFSPELQKAYLIPEYQGYESEGKAKLRNYDMTKPL
jgi:ribosomal protein S18 acetylase RimI-like enzyme